MPLFHHLATQCFVVPRVHLRPYRLRLSLSCPPPFHRIKSHSLYPYRPAQAFLLAYLSSTGPKALSILISLLRKNRSSDAGPAKCKFDCFSFAASDQASSTFCTSLSHLRSGCPSSGHSNSCRYLSSPLASSRALSPLEHTEPSISRRFLCAAFGTWLTIIPLVGTATSSSSTAEQVSYLCAVLVAALHFFKNHSINSLTAIAQRSTASANRPNKRDLRLLARFLAACIGSAASFHLINRTDPPETNGLAQAQGELPAKQDEVQSAKPPSQERNRRSKIPPGLSDLRRPDLFIAQPRLTTSGVPLAGKTIDLTIFAAVRALDTLLQLVPQSSNPRIRRVWQAACKAFGPFIFITSSATIMHAFFYAPSRLPRTYVSWIQRLARLDERLLHALRQIRYGNFVYGQDTGMAPLLKGMCEDYGVPVEWGDPAKSIPIPCELVHHGSGP